MRKKLGLIDAEKPEDIALIDSLLEVMADTGSDFTNTFRSLLRIRLHTDPSEMGGEGIPEKTEAELEDASLLEYLLTQSEGVALLWKRKAPKISLDQLKSMAMLAQKNPYMLYMLGTTPEAVMAEFKKHEEHEKFKDLTNEQKIATDTAKWRQWIASYRARVQQMVGAGGGDIAALNKERAQVMKSNNPKYVLRNYLAQNAIMKAEEGDYSEVDALLKRLHDPYALSEDDDVEEVVQVCVYNKKRPDWAGEICVTCSS